jgi:hypothetical protein
MGAQLTALCRTPRVFALTSSDCALTFSGACQGGVRKAGVLGSGTLQRPLVEHSLARGADLPLDLVRDPRALAESVLDDRGVPVTPILPVHFHLRVVTRSARTS